MGPSTSTSSSASPTASSASSRRGTVRWLSRRHAWLPPWPPANAVVLKPSELAPLAALRFGELCVEAGLPPGLVNVVPAGPEGGEALVRHPGIGKISLHRRRGHRARGTASRRDNLTPVVAELGGKSANVVFADADLDTAAVHVCSPGPADAVRPELRVRKPCPGAGIGVRRVRGAISCAVIDAPTSATPRPTVMFGPVISRSLGRRPDPQRRRGRRQRAGRASCSSAAQRLGGDLAKGYFIEPTVFGDVDNASALAQTETFGPVVSIIRFGDEADALRLANDTPYGLNAFIQTRDLTRAHRFRANWRPDRCGSTRSA